jgi:hypothetical protein
MKHLKPVLLVVVALLVVGAAGAYWYVAGRTHVIAIPEAELRDKLAERMPFTRTYALLLQVTLDNARVALVEGSDRVDAGVDLLLNIRVGRQPLNLGGSVDLSGGIAYRADGGQFFLVDPRIERLDVQGVPEKHREKVRDALTRALAEYFATRPLHTLKTTDLKQAAARMLLKDVVVADRQLVITLGL